MKKVKLSLLFCVFTLVLKGQTVLVIDNDNISLQDFKNVFYKNNNDIEINKEYLDEYIDLFINFKLKVKEAESLQMDTLSTFVQELEGYKQQLIKPYLKNKEFDENMILEAYERMLQDVKVSHILIRLDEKSKEVDIKAAYDKIMLIREKIINKNIAFGDVYFCSG